MIELRMNNGIVQYRHCLKKLSDGTVFSGTWSEWVNAGQVVPVRGLDIDAAMYRSPKHAPDGTVMWFDEAADINSVDWQKLAKDIGPKAPTVSAHKLWMDYGNAWKQRADFLGHELSLTRIDHRKMQVQRDASNASNKKLIAERDAAVASWRDLSARYNKQNHELMQVKAHLDLMSRKSPQELILEGKVNRLQTENHKLNADCAALSTEVSRRNALHHDCSGQLRTALQERDEVRAELALERQKAETWRRSSAQLQSELARTASRSTRARDLLKRMSDLFGEVLPWSRIPDYHMVRKLVEDSNGELLRED